MSHYVTDLPHHDPDPPAFRKRVDSRVWAGGFIVLAGLGLIVLGGCFLIGIMEMLRQQLGSGNGIREFLQIVLFLLAFACFGGAACVLFIGIRGLYRVLQNQPSDS